MHIRVRSLSLHFDSLIRNLKRFYLLALCCAACAPKKQPVSLIFDTDMAPDYDDVGAMAVLHALADSGEVDILATVSSNKQETTAFRTSTY